MKNIRFTLNKIKENSGRYPVVWDFPDFAYRFFYISDGVLCFNIFRKMLNFV